MYSAITAKQHSFDRLSYVLYVLFALAVFLLTKVGTLVLLPVLLLIFASSLLNLQLGVCLWLIVAPLIGLIGNLFESIPMLFNPVLVFGAVANFMFRKSKLKLFCRPLFFYLFITASAVVMSLIYHHYESVNAVINFVFIMIISYLLIIVYINHPGFYKHFVLCFLLSGLVALAVAVGGEGGMRRLALGDSVRQLSNVLSFSSTMTVLILMSYGRSLKKNFKYLLIAGTVIFFAGLLLTVSRGAIIAFLVSITVAFGLYLYLLPGVKKKAGVISRLLLFLIIIVSIGYNYFSNNFATSIDVISQRFQGDELSSGSGIRQYIWEKVLTSYNTWEWAFGTGVGGFRAKSAAVGVFFYSHSVFIDVIATSGVLALVVLIIYMLRNIVLSLRGGLILPLGISVFIILNFISHGSITSLLFWIGIGLAKGAILYDTYSKKSKRPSNPPI